MAEGEHRRNNLEVMKDILVAAQAGAVKTHLVYKANSNFKHIKAYLETALSKGLLIEKRGLFWITPKGEEFVARVLDLEAMISLEPDLGPGEKRAP